MPKYIVVTAASSEEGSTAISLAISGLTFCKDAKEVQEALPRPAPHEEDEWDWAVFEIIPGSNKPKECSIIFDHKDGRTIKSISSNGIHPGDL